jgi:gliding motility-associated-like protein
VLDVSLLAINQFGCADSAFSQVAVAFDRVFPPNAFSPNAALEEDREFRIYSEGIVNDGYKLLIFNRWGEVIFTSYSQEEGWNGKMKNGSNAPAGAYFWVLEFSDFVGNTYAQQGTVTLLY